MRGKLIAMAQLSLVTSFCASVDVTHYSWFEDVFRIKIGTEVSFSDCVFILKQTIKPVFFFSKEVC